MVVTANEGVLLTAKERHVKAPKVKDLASSKGDNERCVRLVHDNNFLHLTINPERSVAQRQNKQQQLFIHKT